MSRGSQIRVISARSWDLLAVPVAIRPITPLRRSADLLQSRRGPIRPIRCPGQHRAPGYMPPMLNATNAGERADKIAMTPLRRIGKPIEVAYGVLFLASELTKPRSSPARS
jgi:NAD(P)-dependent dehydrogenase (short-subunit alcohol dehydrogenase family)